MNTSRRSFLQILGFGAVAAPVAAKAAAELVADIPAIAAHDDARFVTGDITIFPDGNPRVGWVRCNGRTIGAAASGATERANNDTEALFRHLWDNTNLDVSGGRDRYYFFEAGTSKPVYHPVHAGAPYDFLRNKTIRLPDLRGRFLVGYDNMGPADFTSSSAHSHIISGYTSGNHTHTITPSDGAHTHTISTPNPATNFYIKL